MAGRPSPVGSTPPLDHGCPAILFLTCDRRFGRCPPPRGTSLQPLIGFQHSGGNQTGPRPPLCGVQFHFQGLKFSLDLLYISSTFRQFSARLILLLSYVS